MGRTVKIENEDATGAFGLELSKSLKPGSVIALTGELGVGKTTLTKAIAEGLGIRELVKSPTFNIVNEHTGGDLPLFHFDVYRLEDQDEFYEIGYEEYFYGNGVSVVEWADKIADLLPPDAIRIDMRYGNGEEERIYDITGY